MSGAGLALGSVGLLAAAAAASSPRGSRASLLPSSPRQRAGVGLLLLAGTGLAWWRLSRSAAPVELAPEGVARLLPAPSPTGVVPLSRSVNGWPAHPDPAVLGLRTYAVPLQSGRTVSLWLHPKAAPALVQMIQWWDQHVEPIDPADTGSFAYRPVRGYGWSSVSNHASGTAVDLNGSRHRLGRRGTVPAGLAEAIRAKAAELGLRWGGTYRSRADEMHVEVESPPPPEVTTETFARWEARSGARVS